MLGILLYRLINNHLWLAIVNYYSRLDHNLPVQKFWLFYVKQSVLATSLTQFSLFAWNKNLSFASSQSIVKEMTGNSTVPSVFIDHKFVGGSSDVQDKFDSGELSRLLQQLGIVKQDSWYCHLIKIYIYICIKLFTFNYSRKYGAF